MFIAGGSALSAQNPRLIAARKLTRRAGRRAAGRFLAEGAQAVREALASGVVHELLATDAAARRHPDLIAAAQARGARVDLIDDRAAAGLSDTVTPQGLVAVCDLTDVTLQSALAAGPRLVVAMLEASDPGNAGTILRTADAAGAGAVVFAGDSIDPHNGKVVRASAGSLFHVDVVTGVALDAVIEAAHAAGLQVLATSGGARAGAVDLYDLADQGTLAAPTVWLMGNEAHGLPAAALESADLVVQIPILGRAESLNLSVAAALCLYASARAHRGAVPGDH